jgi:di/tricarboxylate transporter
VHRRGQNLRDKLSSLTFEFGDTLLLLGTEEAINALRSGDDILLIDRPAIPTENRHKRMPLVIAAILAVIVISAVEIVLIEIASFLAVVGLFLTGAVRPKEGYAAVQWNILFMIFAMLGMGIAMQHTGADRWLSNSVLSLVENAVTPENKPMVMLVCVYFVTMVLTEVLSNNAAGVIMATISIPLAQAMGVDPRPFLIAVTIAASAAFATPIGYQTNTYVYGVGGYRFADFVKIGVPLNFICAITALLIIPRFWPF